MRAREERAEEKEKQQQQQKKELGDLEVKLDEDNNQQ